MIGCWALQILTLQDKAYSRFSAEKDSERKVMQDANPRRPKAMGPAEGLELMVDLLGQASLIDRENP